VYRSGRVNVDEEEKHFKSGDSIMGRSLYYRGLMEMYSGINFSEVIHN
jgi:hypothetical protein